MLLAAVSLGSYDGENYYCTPLPSHIIGTMIALVIFHACINSLSTAWLNHLTKTYAVFHIAVLFSACVALLVLQKDKHDASYAFTYIDPEPLSGWTPPGFSFLFGFLSVAWVSIPQQLLPKAQHISRRCIQSLGVETLFQKL
jgi:amino acid transporter